MPDTYKIMSRNHDGTELTPEELFEAWVQMAYSLSATLPTGLPQALCAAVYEAVMGDRAKESN